MSTASPRLAKKPWARAASSGRFCTPWNTMTVRGVSAAAAGRGAPPARSPPATPPARRRFATPSRSRSALAAGAVHAVAAGAGEEHEQQAADDGDVLPEVRALNAEVGAGEFPVAVRDGARDYHEQDHQDRGIADLHAEDDEQAAAELD